MYYLGWFTLKVTLKAEAGLEHVEGFRLPHPDKLHREPRQVGTFSKGGGNDSVVGG